VSPDSTCLCGCGITRQRFVALMAHPHVAAQVWEHSQAQLWGTVPAQSCSLSTYQHAVGRHPCANVHVDLAPSRGLVPTPRRSP